jgi:hypothetical protein
MKKKSKKSVYTKDDYESNDGMMTSIWGASMWHFLHTMSFNYPVKPTSEDKKKYRNFILSLTGVLPCKHCRDNLEKNFKLFPLKMEHMKNRETFSMYVYQLHETVNQMLNKKSKLSFEDVRDRYEHFRSKCVIETKTKCIKRSKSKSRSKTSHKGCTKPFYGKKSKCVIKIIPHDQKCETFQISKKCILIK